MRKKMSREEQIEFLRTADQRANERMERYLRVPIVRNILRRPAKGQKEDYPRH